MGEKREQIFAWILKKINQENQIAFYKLFSKDRKFIPNETLLALKERKQRLFHDYRL